MWPRPPLRRTRASRHPLSLTESVDITSAVYRCSALRASERPGEWFPHVAVAGRSNVGKSSFINWLFRQPLARVAKAPGKTRTLNFFLVNRSFYLVDLPGYGYAKVPVRLREEWGRELGRYLAEERRLAGAICLLDIRHGATSLDEDLHRLLVDSEREQLVVLTKADKVGRGRRASMRQRVQLKFGLAVPPLVVSVRTGEGRREVLARVQDLVSLWKERQRSD